MKASKLPRIPAPQPAPRPLSELATQDTDPIRVAGQALFDAADLAIRRALDSDSRQFLETTRQDGGE